MPSTVAGAVLQCTFGEAPCQMGPTPGETSTIGGQPACTAGTNVPFVNITGFTNCKSLANPATLASTIANGGKLTPEACTPITAGGDWVPGFPKGMHKGKAMLTDSSILMCAYGGVISVVQPGQTVSPTP